MNVSVAVDRIISFWWIYFIVGLVALAVRHRQSLKRALKTRSILAMKPAAKDFSLIFLGSFLLLSAYAIFFEVANFILPLGSPIYSAGASADTATGALKMWKDFVPAGSLASVMGLVLAGISLMMSGGYRWLVNLAKVLVTFAAIDFVVFALISVA